MQHTPDYLKPYQDAVDTHGGTFEATLWISKKYQIVRFKTFCDFVDFNDQTILDVGCGIGDFAQYLIDSKISFQSFHGLDAMKEMIETASNRNLERSSFSAVDIVNRTDVLGGYDWITISGTLNAMDEVVARKLIDSCFEACKKGVAFNFLSDRSGRDSTTEDLSPASRFNTLSFIDNALRLSPFVEFTQTYLDGHDATIVIKKHEIPQ